MQFGWFKRTASFAIAIAVLLLNQTLFAKSDSQFYGARLCAEPKYVCVKVKRGETWSSLWKNPQTRDVIQRINRTNMRLRAGMVIAVPKNMKTANIWSVSPFPKYIDKKGSKLIIIDQKKHAWAAYSKEGELEWWGPISSGKKYCPDIKRSCKTKIGRFYVFDKRDEKCFSKKFPVGRGGAKMPYCMFFYKGFAVHGSKQVPGYHASHGCVRVFTKDAQWLNENFVDMPLKADSKKGTKVIIMPH